MKKLEKYWPYCTRNRAITNTYSSLKSSLIVDLLAYLLIYEHLKHRYNTEAIAQRCSVKKAFCKIHMKTPVPEI